MCDMLTLPSLLPSFQAEETKVLRLQVELSQAKGELERRTQEKEEETEVARYLSFLHQLISFQHRPTLLHSC